MKGQTGQTVAGKALVLIAVQLNRSVEASMTLVWPHRPLNTVNSMPPLPEARGRLSIGTGTAATRIATTSTWKNPKGNHTGEVGPANPPSIRSPPAELLTV